MTKTIDLHIHTTASDGTVSPAAVVRCAKELGLSAVAITDHDTVSGCAEAAAAGQELGLEVVPGVELSSRYGKTIHILGYFVRTNSPALTRVLSGVVAERDARNRKMAALMAADGIPIDYDQMCSRFGTSIGRPHFGEVLVELGRAESVQDAFDRYIEKGQPYYLPRRMISIERSVEVIREAGGVPVLAHPFQYKLEEPALRQLIEHCMDHGLLGLECRYSLYDEEQSQALLKLAREYGLVPTGGSDFHGSNKPHIAIGTGTGSLAVPAAWLEGLRAVATSTKKRS
ncbi:MAG: PHP domain-containing protein [Oscillospiraceae bacterium]|nr:PHP domain-containing protein [Oscillospiraceae bacterium]